MSSPSSQVLKSWKTRRLLPTVQLDGLLTKLQSATFPTDTSSNTHFSRNDILRRIEDDRERHKRLRERIWVLPVPSLLDLAGNNKDGQGKLSTVLSTRTSSNSPASPASPAQTESKLVSLAEYARENNAKQEGRQEDVQKREDAIDVEFEQAWEREIASRPNGAVLDETDRKAMEEENVRCFGSNYV
jgi:CTD kinase subunit gamma